MNIHFNRRNFRKAFIVSLCRLLSVLIGLAYVKYYTNTLSVEQVGEFFFLGTISYIISALLFVPLEYYLQSKISSFSHVPLLVLRSFIIKTLLLGACVFTIISVPFVMMGQMGLWDIPLLYSLAAFLYVCSTLRNLINIRGQSNFVAVVLLFESIARLISFVFISLILGATARTLLFSACFALIVEAIIVIFKAMREFTWVSEGARLDGIGKVVKTTLALTGGAASNAIQLQSYRVLFPMVGHPNTAASLAVISNIGSVGMGAVAQVFSQLLTPRIYNTNGKFVEKYAIFACALTIAMLVIVMPFSELLVKYLTNPVYLPYSTAVGVGIIIESCNMLIGAYGIYLTLHGQVGILFKLQMIGASISLLGCSILASVDPVSPLMIGLVLSCSQLLIVPILAYQVNKLIRLNSTVSMAN